MLVYDYQCGVSSAKGTSWMRDRLRPIRDDRAIRKRTFNFIGH